MYWYTWSSQSTNHSYPMSSIVFTDPFPKRISRRDEHREIGDRDLLQVVVFDLLGDVIETSGAVPIIGLVYPMVSIISYHGFTNWVNNGW